MTGHAAEQSSQGAPLDLRRVRLISFDCYGTLIDWERGLLAALAPWRRRVGLGVDDEAVLAAFAEAEPQAEQAQPKALYPDILRDAFDRLAQALGAAAPTQQEREALARSVGHWPPFADTADALRALGRRCRLAVLSNVDRASFTRTQRLLGVEFDAVVTAEDVGAYKPDPRMFEALDAAAQALGAAPDERLHAAQSLYHDILPARARGLWTCWVDRRQGRAGGAARAVDPRAARPDLTVGSLDELARAFDRA